MVLLRIIIILILLTAPNTYNTGTTSRTNTPRYSFGSRTSSCRSLDTPG